MRQSKIPKYCTGIVDIQESVFPKFQAFSYSSMAVTDKTVLGGQVIMYSNLIDPCTVATNKYNNFSILGRNKYFAI